MQLSLSDLNLVYACTRDKTLMIDVQAREISERDLELGLRLAHPEVGYNGICSYFLTFSSASFTKKTTFWSFRLSSLLNLKSSWNGKLANLRRNINCPWLKRERWKKSRTWRNLVLKLFLQILHMGRCCTLSNFKFSVRDSSFISFIIWLPVSCIQVWWCEVSILAEHQTHYTMLYCLLSVWKWR